MPIVDPNRLKGNAAAFQVAALLSQLCLVRPVAADSDVGVDLYCETTREQMPFLHFWIQVKSGTRQIRLFKDGETASCSFKRDHLAYWARQPVPVLGALIRDPFDRDAGRSVYIVDISRHIMNQGLPEKKEATLRSSFRLQFGDQDGIRRFVYDFVEATTALWQFRIHGVVKPVPRVLPEYWQNYPMLPIVRYQDLVSDQIRRSATISLLQAFLQGQLSLIRPETRRILGKLAGMYDFNHWENPMAAAVCLHSDEEYVQARKYYQEALDCINRDPHAPERRSVQANRELIEFLVELTQRQEPIRLPES
ncbi:DUF4365 domain-containing protein [Candidatus Bipolaricaulota bacterium]